MNRKRRPWRPGPMDVLYREEYDLARLALASLRGRHKGSLALAVARRLFGPARYWKAIVELWERSVAEVQAQRPGQQLLITHLIIQPDGRAEVHGRRLPESGPAPRWPYPLPVSAN